MGVGGLKKPVDVAMSFAKTLSHLLHEQEGPPNSRMSESRDVDVNVCCDCFMQLTISVDIPKRDRVVFMLAKNIAMRDMKVLLALRFTHASPLVAGKRLVGGEGVYKG